MKVYVVVNDRKDIQKVTANCEEALELVNVNKNFRAIPYEVQEPETNLKSMSEFSEREYQPLHYNSEIKFGKHKGKSVGDLLMECPDYLSWAIDNINLKLDEECLGLLEEAIKTKGVKR